MCLLLPQGTPSLMILMMAAEELSLIAARQAETTLVLGDPTRNLAARCRDEGGGRRLERMGSGVQGGPRGQGGGWRER